MKFLKKLFPYYLVFILSFTVVESDILDTREPNGWFLFLISSFLFLLGLAFWYFFKNNKSVFKSWFLFLFVYFISCIMGSLLSEWHIVNSYYESDYFPLFCTIIFYLLKTNILNPKSNS